MTEFLNSIDLYVNYIQVLAFLIPASFRNCLSLSVGTMEWNHGTEYSKCDLKASWNIPMILRQEEKAVKAAEENLERLYDDIDDLDESIVHTLEGCLGNLNFARELTWPWNMLDSHWTRFHNSPKSVQKELVFIIEIFEMRIDRVDHEYM